jgi:hypothetical protein
MIGILKLNEGIRLLSQALVTSATPCGRRVYLEPKMVSSQAKLTIALSTFDSGDSQVGKRSISSR